MKPQSFLDQLDDERIVAAIRKAERHTSGEIRVYVSNKDHADAQSAAIRCFQRLKMEQTAGRNGVLIYLVPKTRQFALVGDEAIHRHLSSGSWEEIAQAMSDSLKTDAISAAVEQTITRLGRELAHHFPSEKGDRNELPDEILRDEDPA